MAGNASLRGRAHSYFCDAIPNAGKVLTIFGGSTRLLIGVIHAKTVNEASAAQPETQRQMTGAS